MPSVDFPLYLITARQQTNQRPLLPLLHDSVDAGLPALQIREKDLTTKEVLSLARQVVAFARTSGVRVLINDRVDVAQASEADGVHLRANSFPVSVTRKLLGDDRLIGISAHSVEDVCRADADGADFVVLGPIYETPSKIEYGPPLGLRVLETAVARSTIPVFAIGGVTLSRVPEVRQTGAFGIAVISAILSSPDVSHATRALVQALHTSV